MSKLTDQLIRHEGERLQPYKDTVGKWTIGVGHNLTDNGISKSVSRVMLTEDILTARDELLTAFPAFGDMQDARLDVLINMSFNLGITRLKKFKKMIAALVILDYSTASIEMLDSAWADQVGQRAIELSIQMKHGRYA